MKDLDYDQVATVIREAAQREALPRFRRLASHEISEKKPNDLLTVADLATEKALEEGLGPLLPGSVVVGEEAVSERPEVLEALAGDKACWVVDPIDGTINFAGGLPLFATMVALVRHGRVEAAWIYDVVHDVMATAARGSGAWYDGKRVRFAPPADSARYSGCLHLGGKDREMAARSARNFDKVGPVLVLHCAGLEYQAMLINRLHYALYHHTNPWDHAPGSLLVEEAGGYAARLDGTPYDVGVIHHPWPYLVAASRECWEDLRRLLFELP